MNELTNAIVDLDLTNSRVAKLNKSFSDLSASAAFISHVIDSMPQDAYNAVNPLIERFSRNNSVIDVIEKLNSINSIMGTATSSIMTAADIAKTVAPPHIIGAGELATTLFEPLYRVERAISSIPYTLKNQKTILASVSNYIKSSDISSISGARGIPYSSTEPSFRTHKKIDELMDDTEQTIPMDEESHSLLHDIKIKLPNLSFEQLCCLLTLIFTILMYFQSLIGQLQQQENTMMQSQQLAEEQKTNNLLSEEISSVNESNRLIREELEQVKQLQGRCVDLLSELSEQDAVCSECDR